ncbi:DUF3311 domain-containing protein [Halomonas icarae]|uniref:DUF3311 domain-containing protein n=1 Tax=Halomonas icarae TaxID=2691040 RepID=A0A7X4VZC5_9GAMM|nr:DUF3311 domain-containing protein [Halomonas icarae]MDR5901623.1 DUF3311 domain-containing protein [Halomonas icarae]NAW12972.1 DUF3311 domain-containing protein [Halomonas icarae]
MSNLKRLPSKGMLLYFAICTLAMVWPGALIANRIDPIIMGLPFFIFWYVAWVFVMFIGLIITYRQEGQEATDDE